MSARQRIGAQKFEEDQAGPKSDFFNDFSDTNTVEATPESRIPASAQNEKMRSTKLQRVKTGVLIFGSFVLILLAGPFYCCLFIFAIEIGVFRDIINLKRNYIKEAKIRGSAFLVWYIYIIGAVYFFIYNFHDKLQLSPYEPVRFLCKYRNTLFFGLYVIGFLGYVLSLRFGFIRYQVRLLLETHISLLLVMSMGSMMHVIYEGIIWFLVAALGVVLNDTFAYEVGVRFGRTKLIDLSPKKTLEGFIAGFFGSLVVMRMVVWLTSFPLFRFTYCPHSDIGIIPFQLQTCELADMYLPRHIWISLYSQFFGRVFTSEFVLHATAISLFGSIVAPFAGFFASGLKRGLKIKVP